MFTSGTTGTPKGVRIPLSALENFVEWMLSLPAVAACGAGVSVNQARFSFDLSVADLWPTFAAGGTVRALETAEQEDLPALYDALEMCIRDSPTIRRPTNGYRSRTKSSSPSGGWSGRCRQGR